MIKTLKALVQHLRDQQHRIVRQATVSSVMFDPTYGPQERNEEIDVVDFDRLLDEIDEFAAFFKEEDC